MKKCLVIAAAALTVLGAGSALAAGGKYNTQVIKPNVQVHPPKGGGRLVVATRLVSAKRGCQVNREVTLYRENGTVDVKTDVDYTDSSSRALFHTYGEQAFYYVRAEKKSGYGYFCRSSRSVVASGF